ncbi:MAG: hypothetical protein V1646_01130 [bacterium]
MIFKNKFIICLVFLTVGSACNAISDIEGKALIPTVEKAIQQVKGLEDKVGKGDLASIDSGILATTLHGKKLAQHDFSDIADITKAEIEGLLKDISKLQVGGGAPELVAGRDLAAAEEILKTVGNLKTAIPLLENVIKKNLNPGAANLVALQGAVDKVIAMIKDATK